MAGRLSRRNLARYAASQLIDGSNSTAVIQQLAAYLIETRRTKEAELLVKDIEAAMAESGVVVADVTSARPLTEEVLTAVRSTVSAKDVRFRTHEDESLLGGVIVQLPEAEFDGSISGRIAALKALQNE